MIGPAAQLGIKLVVGYCSSNAAAHAVRAFVPAATTAQKVKVVVASYGIGSAVGAAASRAVINDANDIQEGIATFKKVRKEQK